MLRGCSGWRSPSVLGDVVAAATSAALVATAIGVAGVLAVWTFEAGRDRLFTDGRLFGVDADLLWQGPVEEVDAGSGGSGRDARHRGRRPCVSDWTSS